MWNACRLLFLFLLASPAFASQVGGIPRIVDADTIYLAGDRIRFAGIDAPETDQTCLTPQGQASACGIEARNKLQQFAGNRVWVCELSGRDRYKRSLGTCSIDGEDVSRWLVRSGWALAFRRYSTAYVADEDWAREHRVGLWGGAFLAPWDWRHRGASTVILGALQVPIDAQKKLLPPVPLEVLGEHNCIIKARISERGCIYHLPGDHFYARMKMQSSGTHRWFCSEAEAQAAGCRRSKL